MFNAQGKALLADFGIATALATTNTEYTMTLIGSLKYMAPEQFQGMISKKGDQYALACIAYTLFTGHVPFQAPDLRTLMYRHLYEDPIAPKQLNPHLPPHIEQAILKAMAKQRTERYPDIAAFLTALQIPITRVSPYNRSQKHKQDWIKEGNTYFKTKRYRAALTAYNHALRLDPYFSVAYNNKGAALYCLGRYGAALTAYNHALRLDPYFSVAYHGKGLILEHIRRSEEADHAYKKARQLGYKP